MNAIEQLKVVLANSYAFQLKAQNFHWNVTGPNFPQYHEFFGSLYSEVFDACDAIAEHIRAANSFVPGSFSRFSELSQIQDELNIPNATEMVSKLFTDNTTVINSLIACYDSCGNDKQLLGLQNFLQDRIDIHKKHGWMLSATKG